MSTVTSGGGWASPDGPGGAGGGGWAAPSQPAYGGQPAQHSGQPQPTWGQPGYAAPGQFTIQPGVVPLRPLTVGELLDGAITIVRRYPRATLAVSAVIAFVLAFVDFGFQQITTDATVGAGTRFLASIANTLVSQVAALIASGFVTAVAGSAILGRNVTLAEVWTKVRPRVAAVVGVSLLVGLITLVSLVGLIVAALVPFTFYAFVTPVVVLENSRVGPSLRRSRQLVQGSFWRTLGVLLLGVVFSSIVAVIFLVPFGIVVALTDGHFAVTASTTSTTLALVLLDLGSAVAATLTLPFNAGVHALLYVDQRMRKEGLDVSLRQAAQAPAGT